MLSACTAAASCGIRRRLRVYPKPYTLNPEPPQRGWTTAAGVGGGPGRGAARQRGVGAAGGAAVPPAHRRLSGGAPRCGAAGGARRRPGGGTAPSHRRPLVCLTALQVLPRSIPRGLCPRNRLRQVQMLVRRLLGRMQRLPCCPLDLETAHGPRPGKCDPRQNSLTRCHSAIMVWKG